MPKQLFILSLLGIFLVAYFLQTQLLLLNVDASWLAEASKRMLKGGTYTKDFFDNNPPWILYLSAPPVIASQLFSISIVYTFRLYVLILVGISLFFSYVLFKEIFSKEDSIFVEILTIVLAVLFLWLPADNFGQREHFLFVLTFPYFLLVTLRMEDKNVPLLSAILIGILAGTGLLLKPYFLLPLFFVELFFAMTKKRLKIILRPELIVILLLMFLYLMLLLIKHADYLYAVIPFSLPLVYPSIHRPLGVMLKNSVTLFCFFLLILAKITFPINRYKNVSMILFLVLVGFIFSYLLQQSNYPYRLLPAFSLAIFLAVMFIGIYATSINVDKSIHSQLFLLIIGLSALLFLTIVGSAVLYPWQLVCLVLAVILIVLSWKQTDISKNYYQFAIACLLLFLFALIPFYEMLLRYSVYNENRNDFQKLITYINTHAPHESVYIFSTDITYSFPILAYTPETTSASRLSGFWMLPALIKPNYLNAGSALTVQQSDIAHLSEQRSQLTACKNLLTRMVVEDIATKKPKLILFDVLLNKNSLFIDISHPNASEEKFFIPFDFLVYFKQAKNFSDVFQHYQFREMLDSPGSGLFRLAVFERVN